MKKLAFLIAPAIMFASGTAQTQTLPADVENFPEAWGGMTNPGIMCKTRTNNEATVRNLAMGVFNESASPDVALNCGFPAPLPATLNTFTNQALVQGFMDVRFVRTSGTTNAEANNAFCAVFAADALSPNSPANVDGAQIGTAQPNFVGATGSNEIDTDTLDSFGIPYPGDEVMFTAFCRIPQGVRLQNIVYRPDVILGWDDL